MFKLYRMLKGIGGLLNCVLLLAIITWTEKRQTSKTCQAIDISINNTFTQRFIEVPALLAYLAERNTIQILGAPMKEIPTRKIENILKSHSFVRSGTVYKSWKGKLKIVVLPRKPIARILYQNKKSQYIDEGGTLIPLSPKYTARVLLIDGQNLPHIAKSLKEHTYGTALLALLTYIDRNPFWRAQINYLHLDEAGKISMYMQIGKQKILFGKPENIEKKLSKLQLFYKKVLPYKGWTTYKHINLEFDNQIVCE